MTLVASMPPCPGGGGCHGITPLGAYFLAQGERDSPLNPEWGGEEGEGDCNGHSNSVL